jgi:acyl dehydratase
MTETTRWFEDFHAGDVVSLGSRTLTRDEIVAFAARWDPQPMHLDEASGNASLLHGLSASGWHTGCVLMRLFADNLLNRSASLGSPGIDSLKWLRPVHPGDTLTATLTILDARPSASRPTLGLLRCRFDVANQHGEAALRMESTLMMGRRTAA